MVASRGGGNTPEDNLGLNLGGSKEEEIVRPGGNREYIRAGIW